MDQILSKSEVDALLSAVNEGLVEADDTPEVDPTAVRPFDLTSQDRVARERLPGIESIAAKTADATRTLLTGMLKKSVSVTLRTSEITKFGEVMTSFGEFSCLNMFKMHPLKGTSLVVVEPELFLGMLSLLFGARKADYVPKEGRQFTPIEVRLAKKISTEFAGKLAEAFKDVIEISPKYMGTESIPRFAAIASSTDLCITLSLSVLLGDETGGNLSVVIPYASLEPIKDRLKSIAKRDETGDAAWRNSLLSLLMGVEGVVWAEVGRTSLMVQDLLELDVGDVLVLDSNVNRYIRLLVEGVPKFKGLAVDARGNLAFKVHGPIGTEEGAR